MVLVSVLANIYTKNGVYKIYFTFVVSIVHLLLIQNNITMAKMNAPKKVQVRLSNVPEDIMQIIVKTQTDIMVRTGKPYGREAAIYYLLRKGQQKNEQQTN